MKYFKWKRRAKHWNERLWWEKVLFWKTFEKLVCTECDEFEGEFVEVILEPITPFNIISLTEELKLRGMESQTKR